VAGSAGRPATTRPLRVPIVLALVTGFLVWNLVFDLWLGQAERQYLWQNARHLMGAGRVVSLKGTMAAAVRDGALVATTWGLIVAAAVLLSALSVRRSLQREGSDRA
jgi:hypothetical protein